ncbi:TPA: fimbria/pilus periplasmic chaperone, partial [Klebsiella pneumoniae]|nr:fimbria/pilus periplasmic chaperone [Klebsiella pneumoniae]
MRLPLTSALLLAALSCTPSCFAVAPEASGISLSQFRIIYPGADTKGVTWSLTNNTDRAWLIQSWMRPVDFTTGLPMPETESSASSAKIPFLVTPPLKRVDAGEGMTLRIRLTELSLPKDRESVFYLSVKAIPAITDSDSASNGKLVVAVVNNIKLFYRPEGLPAGGLKKAAA